MKILRYGRINFRCIHYFEILKFEVYSLFWDFFSWQGGRGGRGGVRIHPPRTPHATVTHSCQKTNPCARITSVHSENSEKFLCASYSTELKLKTKNTNVKALGIRQYATYLFSLLSPRTSARLKNTTHLREKVYNGVTSCSFQRFGPSVFWND